MGTSRYPFLLACERGLAMLLVASAPRLAGSNNRAAAQQPVCCLASAARGWLALRFLWSYLASGAGNSSGRAGGTWQARAAGRAE